MKDLHRISVFFAVAGLGLMYASSLYLELEHVNIGEIERSWAGRNVRVSGEAVKVSKSGSHTFINLNDSTGQILVVDFDSKNPPEKGQEINVTGHVAIYEGRLEIIARDIR